MPILLNPPKPHNQKSGNARPAKFNIGRDIPFHPDYAARIRDADGDGTDRDDEHDDGGDAIDVSDDTDDRALPEAA